MSYAMSEQERNECAIKAVDLLKRAEKIITTQASPLRVDLIEMAQVYASLSKRG